MTESALTPGRAKFRELCGQGNLIPVYTELVADCETPVSAFQKLSDSPYVFLLESVERNEEMGRFSFLGCDPAVIFSSRGRNVTITRKDREPELLEVGDDPFHELERYMQQFQPVGGPPETRFAGGAVGFLGYDMVRFFEPTIPPAPKDELDLPEMVFFIARTVLIFDHKLRRLRVVANALVEDSNDPAAIDAAYDAAMEEIHQVLMRLRKPDLLQPINTHLDSKPITPASNTEKHDYLANVSKAQEYIKAGDIFQIVPSQRFETPFDGAPLDLYRSLRFVNPSPYMFCFQFGGEFALVGSSPEVHVRSTNGLTEIRPIAGTRPRGRDAEEDNFNASNLLADPKERAEHVMLVDLARNDLGRICRYGSVEVTDFMIIERYSHVMHIVSHVIGRLENDKTAFDVMRATFPAGTVSGSPKVRAMQIINELEKSKRGTYAGAVGYFGFDGNLDSCITLRSVVLKNGKAYVQAGGGVVADSTPEGEYQETVNKAMGMIRAIERARRMNHFAEATL